MKYYTIRAAILTTALAAGVVGCSSGSSGGASPQSYSAALESNLATCGATARTCFDDANGDPSAMTACRDQLAPCAQQAKQDAQHRHAARHQCFADARTCLAAAADGGGDYRGCVDGFRSCMDATRPPLPPCAQAFEDCRSADGGSVMECGQTYQSCVGDSLPPCVQDFHACLQGGGDVMGCAQSTRACMMDSMGVDGGTPPGPFGTPPWGDDDGDGDRGGLGHHGW